MFEKKNRRDDCVRRRRFLIIQKLVRPPASHSVPRIRLTTTLTAELYSDSVVVVVVTIIIIIIKKENAHTDTKSCTHTRNVEQRFMERKKKAWS